MSKKDFNIDDAGVFFANYIAPWIFAALVGGMVFACNRCAREDDDYKRRQSVPVNKTVMFNPKSIDKNVTISYSDAKKIPANMCVSEFIKVK